MAEWHVAKTGNDANSGVDLANAKLTVSAGLALMSAADTLQIHAGTYTEGITYSQLDSGTSEGARTFIKGFAGETVVLNGVETLVGAVVTTYNQRYITFDNLTFDAVNGSYTAAVLIHGQASQWSDHITLTNCKAKNVQTGGSASITSGDIGVTDVIIDGCEVFNNLATNGSPAYTHGIYLHGLNWIIKNCYIHDNSGMGIQAYNNNAGGINNAQVYNNRITANALMGLRMGDGDDGIAYSNIIWGNGTTATYTGITVGTPATNTRLYNNTIYDNDDPTYGAIDLQAVTNTLIKNNILFGNQTNSVTNISGGATGTVEANNSTDDPFFVAANTNFHLTIASTACIGLGADLTGLLSGIPAADFDGVPRGSVWDIGAYEFISAPSGQPPIEPFNYTSGVDLNGLTGGLFWTAGWVKQDTGVITIDTAPAGTATANKAAKSTGTASATTYYRGFTALDATVDRTISFYFNTSDPDPTTDYYYVYVFSGATAIFVARMQGGQIQLWDNGIAGYQNVATLSANTTYRVEFNFNDVTQPDKYRMRINTQAYSAYYTVANGSLTTVDGIKLIDGNTAAHTTYWADIGVTTRTLAMFIH